jgi:hypothetical protein
VKTGCTNCKFVSLPLSRTPSSLDPFATSTRS